MIVLCTDWLLNILDHHTGSMWLDVVGGVGGVGREVMVLSLVWRRYSSSFVQPAEPAAWDGCHSLVLNHELSNY